MRERLVLARFKADLMLLNIIYGGCRLFISHEALIANLKSSHIYIHTHKHKTRTHVYIENICQHSLGI